MCGLAGALGANIRHEWTEKTLKHLEHRGPDFQKMLKLSPNLTACSSRLAMTDPLPRSHQPMMSDVPGVGISFNGEIYNFRKLREKLSSSGSTFVTDSDTEVLLKSLITLGNKTFELIEGMYALAFFDSNKNCVTLSRDSLGKKPLYYIFLDDTVYWSSSFASLENLTDSSDLDFSAIQQYLHLGYALDPDTFNRKIKAVKPGTRLEIKYKNGVLQCNEFQNPQFSISEERLGLTLRENIEYAVSDRIRGHNKIAISMSGGLDSSIIAITAAKSSAEVTAYSATWPDSDKSRYNKDADSAELIAKKFGIDFKKVDIFPASELEEYLEYFISSMEEPNSNPTGLSMMNLYEEIAKDGHRLVLTGDGADEIVGGYPRYQAAQRIDNYLNLNGQIFDSIFEITRHVSSGWLVKVLASQSSNKSFQNWLHWQWNFNPKEVRAMSQGYSYQKFIETLRNLINQLEDTSIGTVEFNMIVDRLVWLSMESNRKLDRISMHYSIEARSPFQDENVISQALRLMSQNNFKILDKKLLRQIFPELAGVGVRDDKAGFISPVGHWLRHNENLVSKSLETLRDFKLLTISEEDSIKSAPISGNYRRIMQLWSLIVLGKWISQK